MNGYSEICLWKFKIHVNLIFLSYKFKKNNLILMHFSCIKFSKKQVPTFLDFIMPYHYSLDKSFIYFGRVNFEIQFLLHFEEDNLIKFEQRFHLFTQCYFSVSRFFLTIPPLRNSKNTTCNESEKCGV